MTLSSHDIGLRFEWDGGTPFGERREFSLVRITGEGLPIFADSTLSALWSPQLEAAAEQAKTSRARLAVSERDGSAPTPDGAAGEARSSRDGREHRRDPSTEHDALAADFASFSPDALRVIRACVDFYSDLLVHSRLVRSDRFHAGEAILKYGRACMREIDVRASDALRKYR